jgi:hypothetical protein
MFPNSRELPQLKNGSGDKPFVADQLTDVG